MKRDSDKKPAEDSRVSVVGWLVEIGRAAARKLVTVPTPDGR